MYLLRYQDLKSDQTLKTFSDSTGRQYKVDYIYGFGGIGISSKQKDGKFKSLNANKGKGARLLKKYARDVL